MGLEWSPWGEDYREVLVVVWYCVAGKKEPAKERRAGSQRTVARVAVRQKKEMASDQIKGPVAVTWADFSFGRLGLGGRIPGNGSASQGGRKEGRKEGERSPGRVVVINNNRAIILCKIS